MFSPVHRSDSSPSIPAPAMPSPAPGPARRRRGTAAVALGTALLLTAGACGGGDSDTDPTAPSGSQSASTAAPDPAALAGPLDPQETSAPNPDDAHPAGTDPKEEAGSPSSEAHLTVRAIRVGAHGDRDRVVFEFAGEGRPGASVRYVPAPTQQASGRPLDVHGDSYLEVSMTGQSMPGDGGDEEVPVGTVGTEGTPGVTGVAFGGQFEGRAQSVIGLTGTDRPFSVFTLENPTRLVVDVQRAHS